MDSAELLRQRLDRTISEARGITRRAEKSSRGLTQDEIDDVERKVHEAEALKQALADVNSGAVSASLDRLTGGGPGGGSLFAAFKNAGWDGTPGQRVSISAEQAFGKTASFSGDPDDLSPDRYEGAPLGADRRYLYSYFIAQGVGADVSSIQVVEQTARVLPTLNSSGGPVVRGYLDSSTKPEVGTTRALVQKSMKQVAAVETHIPNALLLQPEFRTVVDTDLRLSYERGIEAMTVAAIAASTPASSPGSDIVSAAVHARADMQLTGYNGSLLALKPSDAANLTLLRGMDEQFVRSDPLATFRVVSSPSVTAPLLIDTSAAGKLYLSAPTLSSFEENAGATNSSTIRFEGTAQFIVDREDAIVQLLLTS